MDGELGLLLLSSGDGQGQEEGWRESRAERGKESQRGISFEPSVV